MSIVKTGNIKQLLMPGIQHMMNDLVVEAVEAVVRDFKDRVYKEIPQIVSKFEDGEGNPLRLQIEITEYKEKK